MHYLIFIIALLGLLTSARYFTKSAEAIGRYLGMPTFVIGVFIVGIGTSLPELVSGLISVQKGTSEILVGNVMGANISNILLITGLAVVIHRSTISLRSGYMYIHLHYLIGTFLYFTIVAYDGQVKVPEALFGILMFVVYSIYLVRGERQESAPELKSRTKLPATDVAILAVSAVGIYFGAEYTVSSLESIALDLSVPPSVVALTVLSLGTSLPELAVNVAAIRGGNAELAIGNVLGSCIFNTLIIPSAASFIGVVAVTPQLVGFALPFMGACGLLFYLLTQDKTISVWEGLMFVCLYGLFIYKTATV